MPISYIDLGATLFVPATHKDLVGIASSQKYKDLKSIVIDTEDAISEDQLSEAKSNIQSMLLKFKKLTTLVFLRARNIETLEYFLSLKGIQSIDGFVLPKISTRNLNAYLELLSNTDYAIMPSIESDDLFNVNKLIELKNMLLPYKEKILVIRFGLEDMLKQLQIQRSCEDTLFDLSATNNVVANIIAIFKSAGFAVSGGVYKCFEDDEGLRNDVLRDLKEGLFSKTVIHPRQVSIVNKLYKVSQEEYNWANKLLDSKKTVYQDNKKMVEISTMKPYAKYLLQRANIYGIK